MEVKATTLSLRAFLLSLATADAATELGTNELIRYTAVGAERWRRNVHRKKRSGDNQRSRLVVSCQSAALRTFRSTGKKSPTRSKLTEYASFPAVLSSATGRLDAAVLHDSEHGKKGKQQPQGK